MAVEVTLKFADLANPEMRGFRPALADQWLVRIGDIDGHAHLFVTAGEAQVIAQAWNRIADEIVERERGAA
jgi:hypothetical protein